MYAEILGDATFHFHFHQFLYQILSSIAAWGVPAGTLYPLSYCWKRCAVGSSAPGGRVVIGLQEGPGPAPDWDPP
jgi:hypothetical protein